MDIQKLISLPPGLVPRFHTLEGKDQDSWFCGSDPAGRKVGSGGGTSVLLASACSAEVPGRGMREWLSGKKRLVIHSGGESRRLPAYSPYGKSLLPLPVFRWSKGQYLDQKLLDFQVDFYERILKAAPGSYTNMIASGDVMFIADDRFQGLPEADVLLFGVWVDDQVAMNHGVFFSRKESQDQLAFVIQKPGQDRLRDLSGDYFYLMDSGIVLLNTETTMKLMEKAGWNESRGEFEGGAPSFYDLYGEMLTRFGSEASGKDPGLAGLDVRLVPIHEGEFYHFGSNQDLISSSLALQNRITDQRLTHTRETDHHPSIFQQNSKVGLGFSERNSHIWIENSYIPSEWKLSDHHILTGIPDNQWTLDLPAGICLDMVPLKGETFGLRLYGFSDIFSPADSGEQCWLDQSLDDWLMSRSLDRKRTGLGAGADMLDLRLFPEVKAEETPRLVEFLVHGSGDPGRWLEGKRLSARELADGANAMALYRQRETLKANALQKLASNQHRSIFYYLDLEKAARDYHSMGMGLPPPLPEGEPVIRRINDAMFRARVSGNGKEATAYEEKAFGILREEMIETLRSMPVSPGRNVLDDQILWGRSPVRLDLAGGWTDTPPYCILEGGKVVNLSVELNGQMPIQVYARPLKEPVIVLRSIDLGRMQQIKTFDELKQYEHLGGVFSIPMAALVLAGFGPWFSARSFPDLETQLKAFGCGIEMSLLSAIPKGSGLGTSSNLAATVLGTLSEFCSLNWDKHALSYRTLILEQMLTTGGGWQDQYGGIFGGVKLLETPPGIIQKPSIKWLPDQLFTARENRDMILLYYTGVTRVARDILGEIVKGMFLNSARHLEIFREMKIHARETFETILRNEYAGLAARVATSWEMNQRLDEGTNPEEIKKITAPVEDFLLGYKLLGAGGGGYLLMFAKSGDAALKVRKQLQNHPPNARARFVEFSVSESGFQVSRS
jgi:galactokinase/mevalonate kinase-like predicted kinase